MEQLRANAKEEILSRIRNALRDVPADEKPEQMTTERNYHTHTSQSHEEVVQLFVSRLEDYNAGVHRIQKVEISDTVAMLVKEYSLSQLVMPADIPQKWVPDDLLALRDQQNRLTNEQIGESNSVVLTACAVAIAQTGTIVLDGGPLQGRRVLSLLPDYAFCVVREDQIVGLVPEAVAYLNDTVTKQHQPITFISGPSATSDIELSRVVGVHGPRHLDVLLVS
ncbi:MAG: LUD domain-containing protein [Ktedonobacteraceae bacterium]|nr:LUD domain-containing protein [Ktedonobacteraceae bacterium]